MGEVSDEVYRLGVIFAHTIYSNQIIPEDWKLRRLIGGSHAFILIWYDIYAAVFVSCRLDAMPQTSLPSTFACKFALQGMDEPARIRILE